MSKNDFLSNSFTSTNSTTFKTLAEQLQSATLASKNQTLMNDILQVSKNPSIYGQAIKSFEAQQSMMDKALGFIQTPSVFKEAIKSFETQQSMIDKALSFIQTPSVFEEAIRPFDKQQSIISGSLNLMTNSNILKDTLLNLSSSSFLSYAEILSTLNFELDEDIPEYNQYLSNEVSVLNETLENCPSKSKVIEALSNLPMLVKFILFWIFTDIVMPQMNAVVITPVIQKYVTDTQRP